MKKRQYNIKEAAHVATKWWIDQLRKPHDYTIWEGKYPEDCKHRKIPKSIVKHASDPAFLEKVDAFEKILEDYIYESLLHPKLYVIYTPEGNMVLFYRLSTTSKIGELNEMLLELAKKAGFTDEDMKCFPVRQSMDIHNDGAIFVEDPEQYETMVAIYPPELVALI